MLNRKLIFVTLLFVSTLIIPDRMLSQEIKGLTMEEQIQLAELKKAPSPYFVSFSFTNMVPQGEFQDNIRKSGQGFSIFGGYTFTPAPISIGGEVDIIFNGSDTKYFDVHRTGGWIVGQDTVETQNMLIPITMFFKMQPQVVKIFYPYLEGFVGFNLLSSSGTLNPWAGLSDSKNELTAAFIYGGGAGIGIKFFEYSELPSTHTVILADIKARYVKGSETDYYRADRINYDTSVEFKKFRSKTDMVMLFIGLTVMF